jgi:hypothetical protein
MTWKAITGLLLLLCGPALVAGSARAGASADIGATPMAATPAASSSADVVPPDCAAADAELTRRLQPALVGSRDLPSGVTLGDALASLYKARALCKEGSPARGMLVYIRLSDALAAPSGKQP